VLHVVEPSDSAPMTGEHKLLDFRAAEAKSERHMRTFLRRVPLYLIQEETLTPSDRASCSLFFCGRKPALA